MSLYGTDLLALLPELIVAVTACLVLALDPITPAPRRDLLAWLSVGALALCLGLTGWQISVLNVRVSAFSDLVVIDAYARFWKILLYGVTGITILLSLPYLKAERIHFGEYYGFILLALSGMLVMVSGADLLTIYLGTELMSISLYVMTGLNRSKPRSLEASAKYFVLGAFSSGILLYGISLLYGMAGSTKLASIAGAIGTRGADDPLLLIATILVAVGFGFKLAAVPFHMWTPDVYQGAPTSVTAFMAVAAKAASFAAFMRIFVEGLGGLKADWSLLFLLISVCRCHRADQHQTDAGLFQHCARRLRVDRFCGGRPWGRRVRGNARPRQRHDLLGALCVHDARRLRRHRHAPERWDRGRRD